MDIIVGFIVTFAALWAFVFCAHHGSAAEEAQNRIADQEANNAK